MRSVKRWHWIVISLIIGLIVGYVQQMPEPDWTRAFGDTITQRQFEEGLLRQQNGLPWFRNIVVYPERIEVVGKARPIYIVCGDYFNGRTEARNGQQVAVWRPRCYVAEIPYRPAGKPERDAASGTVMGFLDGLRSKGVVYTYAWWRDPKWGMSIWTGGSFIVIGLIWPTIINVLAFGSVSCIREPKGIDLRNVAGPAGSCPAQTSPNAQDMAAVEQLSSDLQTELAAKVSAVFASDASTTADVPIQALTATSLESSDPDHVSDEKVFGSDADDFYPTERKAHPHQSGGHSGP